MKIVDCKNCKYYNFARKVAKVIDDLKSSHVFFVMQQAFGDISWDEAQDILDSILRDREAK